MKPWLFTFSCMLFFIDMPVRAADFPAVRARPGVTANNVPSISVTGEAEERVRPDLAILSLEAADEAPTVAAAATENKKLSQTLLSTLQKYGLSSSDIETGTLDLFPQYRDRTDPKSGEVVERTFTGYRASTVFRARARDVGDASRIAREIVESGSNLYRSTTFEIVDRDGRLDALRAKAIQNALLRAHRYAQSASLELGDIIQITPAFNPTLSSIERPENRNAPIGQVAVSLPSRANDVLLQAAVTISWELKSKTEGCDANKARK